MSKHIEAAAAAWTVDVTDVYQTTEHSCFTAGVDRANHGHKIQVHADTAEEAVALAQRVAMLLNAAGSASEGEEAPHHSTIDPMALEPHFSYWMNRLTADGLHSKADIAQVLAWYRAALAAARLSMGEVERDAERYRWLRARGVVTRAAKESIVETQGGALLDAAIDAARAKEAP